MKFKFQTMFICLEKFPLRYVNSDTIVFFKWLFCKYLKMSCSHEEIYRHVLPGMKNTIKEQSLSHIDISLATVRKRGKLPFELTYLSDCQPFKIQGTEWRLQMPGSDHVHRVKHHTECKKYKNLDEGGLLRGRASYAVSLGGNPPTLTVPCSRSDLLGSSLAQGPWQKIWSDLTCDWYEAAAKNVLYPGTGIHHSYH